MSKGKSAPAIWLGCVALLLVLSILTAPPEGFFARATPLLIAGGIMTVLWLAAALIIRLTAVPRFRTKPGRFQLWLEQLAVMAGHIPDIRKPIIAVGKALAALVRGIGRLFYKLAHLHPSARTKKALVIWLLLIAVLLALTFIVGRTGGHQDIKVAMRDAVLHEVNRVSLFGWKDVNPGLIAAIAVTAVLLVFALLVRLIAVPRFRAVPGKFQLLLETAVSTLDGLAGVRDPGRPTFVGAYVFAAGVYIFVGTLFELLGLQVIGTNGQSVTLPAPLSDVNAAICLGCLSYIFIFCGGVRHAGLHGAKATLKEFSLPISMSFRLFGALLSGLLVTDLVYHYTALSYGVPVIVGVVFTLLHAIVQTYVLTMLVGMYYGEVTEKPEKA